MIKKEQFLLKYSNSGFTNFDYESILEHHYSNWIQDGDTVIDIGAHAGRHLNIFFGLVGDKGNILAFEPIPDKADFIRSQFHANLNVKIVEEALSNKKGTFDFIFAEGTPEESGLKEREFNVPTAAKPKVISVKVNVLDAYIDQIDKLTYIKIDIEGGEIDCLLGAEQCISKFRPLISAEYGEPAYSVYGHTAFTLYEWAKVNNYVIYDLFLNKINNKEEWLQVVNVELWDFFLVPIEKEDMFVKRIVERCFVKSI